MNSELQNCQQTEPCTVEEIRNSLEQSEVRFIILPQIISVFCNMIHF